MLNEENEKIIKSLLSYDIKYPLTVKGFDDREYKVNKIYVNSDKVMIKITIKGNTFIEGLRDYSLLFQNNLINQLKLFKNNIYND